MGKAVGLLGQAKGPPRVQQLAMANASVNLRVAAGSEPDAIPSPTKTGPSVLPSPGPGSPPLLTKMASIRAGTPTGLVRNNSSQMAVATAVQ